MVVNANNVSKLRPLRLPVAIRSWHVVDLQQPHAHINGFVSRRRKMKITSSYTPTQHQNLYLDSRNLRDDAGARIWILFQLVRVFTTFLILHNNEPSTRCPKGS